MESAPLNRRLYAVLHYWGPRAPGHLISRDVNKQCCQNQFESGEGAGASSCAKCRKFFFGRAPPLFWSKETISRFGERFCDVQCSMVSFLFAVLLLMVPPCPAICKRVGVRAPVPDGVGATQSTPMMLYIYVQEVSVRLHDDIEAVEEKRARYEEELDRVNDMLTESESRRQALQKEVDLLVEQVCSTFNPSWTRVHFR